MELCYGQLSEYLHALLTLVSSVAVSQLAFVDHIKLLNFNFNLVGNKEHYD